MQISLLNGQPADFSELLPDAYLKDPSIDLGAALQPFISHAGEQIFTPLTPNQKVTLSIDQQAWSKDDFMNALKQDLTAHDQDTHRHDQLSMIFHQASRFKQKDIDHYDHIIGDTLIMQANPGVNPILPIYPVLYTYDGDIQVPAKDYLANPTDQAYQKLSTNLIGYLAPQTMSRGWCFILVNDDAYNIIRQAVITKATQAGLTQQVSQLQNLDLSDHDVLTTWLTSDDESANSINRVIQSVLAKADMNATQRYVLPVNLHAMFQPLGFSFISLNNLANTTASDLHAELNQLNTVSRRLHQLNIHKLKQIQNAQTVGGQSKVSHSYNKTSDMIAQRQQQGFSSQIPSIKKQLRRLSALVSRFTSQQVTTNIYHTSHRTFMRPNRRHPDDYNLPGTVQSTAYRPDIHIYLDTSGSITEDQYRTAVTTLIAISKKLNTNLFFTSFSHIISQTVKLQTQNASVTQIYKQINAVPKVGGGTEYENVWKLIDTTARYNRTTGQARQLNFVITDFAYDVRYDYAPNLRGDSTIRTFYMPLAANDNQYQYIRRFAMDFANSMIDHGDINIKSRMLL